MFCMKILSYSKILGSIPSLDHKFLTKKYEVMLMLNDASKQMHKEILLAYEYLENVLTFQYNMRNCYWVIAITAIQLFET